MDPKWWVIIGLGAIAVGFIVTLVIVAFTPETPIDHRAEAIGNNLLHRDLCPYAECHIVIEGADANAYYGGAYAMIEYTRCMACQRAWKVITKDGKTTFDEVVG